MLFGEEIKRYIPEYEGKYYNDDSDLLDNEGYQYQKYSKYDFSEYRTPKVMSCVSSTTYMDCSSRLYPKVKSFDYFKGLEFISTKSLIPNERPEFGIATAQNQSIPMNMFNKAINEIQKEVFEEGEYMIYVKEFIRFLPLEYSVISFESSCVSETLFYKYYKTLASIEEERIEKILNRKLEKIKYRLKYLNNLQKQIDQLSKIYKFDMYLEDEHLIDGSDDFIKDFRLFKNCDRDQIYLYMKLVNFLKYARTTLPKIIGEYEKLKFKLFHVSHYTKDSIDIVNKEFDDLDDYLKTDTQFKSWYDYLEEEARMWDILNRVTFDENVKNEKLFSYDEDGKRKVKFNREYLLPDDKIFEYNFHEIVRIF